MLLKLKMIKDLVNGNVLKRYKATSRKRTYEDAIEALNNLQSNVSYIQNVQKRGNVPHSVELSETLQTTVKYLLRSGVTLEQLDKLSLIHVTGTKGKGSTCAFTESILRHHGYRTGFFSSPHLVAVRERIALDGTPISEDLFTKYFFQVYDKLIEQRDDPYDMPLYFRFLTVLAFNVFLEEKVDVAVIEVGIGGEFDCTNIVRKVPVVGITSLGIDHTSMLGNTIEQIAWQKAGIMKKGCEAFTVRQPETAMQVLEKRSVEKECSLKVVPPYKTVFGQNGRVFGINGDVQKLNASLAVHLAHRWMALAGSKNGVKQSEQQDIPALTTKGLENCKWPGRNQILKMPNADFYLDGAHTTDSMELCIDWFKSKSSSKQKVLFFNLTGNRDPEGILPIAQSCHFDRVLLMPNVSSASNRPDLKYSSAEETLQLQRCENYKKLWMHRCNGNVQSVEVFPNVTEALNSLSGPKPDVLITGSLHLVGVVLSIIDPNLTLSLTLK